MAFNVKKFTQTEMEPRTFDFPIPNVAKELPDCFENGEKPVWKIQGIGSVELGMAEQAIANVDIKEKIISGLTALNSEDVANQIRELIGAKSNDPTASPPDHIAKRIFYLVYGALDPKCDFEDARKFCDRFPTEFLSITQKILDISGMGYQKKKLKSSTAIQK